jgi:L-threonylcarbamoyladenylate synthase
VALTLDTRALLAPEAANTESLASAREAMVQAAHRLQLGQLVGMPTETVYGLAAHADDEDAVARVFAAKGRPSDHPLIVHVAGRTPAEWQAAVGHYARDVPDFAQGLMAACWPGPLTLILPRRSGVGVAAAGGQDSIGLRCPGHPVAQALLQACQALGLQGLAAPSANRFGRVSPTTAQHVLDEFQGLLGDDELLVLDGGACPVGIESTIIDCTRGQPVLLRPGMLALGLLEQAAGQTVLDPHALASEAPRASGTLASHYAPTARVRLMTAAEIRAALDVLGRDARHIAVYSRAPMSSASAHIRFERMPEKADACAQELFAVLRSLDRHDTRLIWVETPPDEPAWDGVLDRLSRAAA